MTSLQEVKSNVTEVIGYACNLQRELLMRRYYIIKHISVWMQCTVTCTYLYGDPDVNLFDQTMPSLSSKYSILKQH